LEAKRDFFAVEVNVEEGVVAIELVEVGTFIETFGVGGKPAAMFGVVEAAAVENQVVDFSLGVGALRYEGRGKGVLCSYRCSLGTDY